jgi:adenylate cyclase, class 2
VQSTRIRNVEIKARDPDPPRTLEAALALGEDHGVLVQRDTYFHAVKGRLKLREIDGSSAELVWYDRADLSGPKVSVYRRVAVLDPAETVAALGEALGVRVVVEKRRRLVLWRNVRIHLDEVAELGRFVELEAVAATSGGLEAEREKVEELRGRLGIDDDRLLVARGYAELLGA